MLKEFMSIFGGAPGYQYLYDSPLIKDRAEAQEIIDFYLSGKENPINPRKSDGHSVISIEQVYDYAASGNAEGSPIMRYFEEAGLELKCLAFQGFDSTNPEGANHCTEHNIAVGSGIKRP